MYTPRAENGVEIEGRKTRKGGSSMKIGALTRYHKVDQVSVRDISVDLIPFPVKEISYRVVVKSWVPLLLFSEYKRYETIGFWITSCQEIYRHLALGNQFTGTELWKTIVEIVNSSKEFIWDSLLKFYDGVLKHGDMSFEHWISYVKDHGDSASPWKVRWSEILSSPRLLKQSFELTNKFIRDYVEWMHSRRDFNGPYMVKAKYTYPGVRARPADYTILSESANERTIFCKKWRDRKVGGVIGLSQSTWPIYNFPEGKKACLKGLLDDMQKFSGLTIRSLAYEGPKIYQELLNNAVEYNCYDLKTAEKLTGLVFSWTGFATDLSDARFPAELAPEMYSGIGPTSFLNEWTMTVVLKALMDRAEVDLQEVVYFADNLATRTKLPPQLYFTEEDSFCGLQVKKGVFGPPSLVTDNPNHRLQFKGRQVQSQVVQYIMRPFLSCIMYGLPNPSITKEFIDYIVQEQNKLEIQSELETYRKDHLKDAVLALDVEEHRSILDRFPSVTDFVKRWFRTQDVDASFVTDLKVSD
jgi:hypothetical protein